MKRSILKKVLAWVIASFYISAFSFAEDIRYDDSWSGQGFSLQSTDHSNVRIIHSVNTFTFNAVQINGENMSVVTMPGVMLPNNEGAPDLPGEGRFIAIPQGAKAKVNIIRMREEVYSNVEIAPAPRIPFENDDSPLVYKKDMEIYGKDAFYPADPVMLSEQKKIRGVDVAILGITPFQYNPVSKELKVLRDIEVEVVFEGGNGQFGETRYRSRWWDPIMADAIMNYSSLPVVEYNWMNEETRAKDDGCEYLIITPTDPDFLSWADSIAEFRNRQGILTDVKTLDEVGGNTTFAIETYINEAYNTWSIPPSAILLLGDYGNNSAINVISPIYDGYCASDNIYADVDNDHLPDIILARITANNTDQLATMVSKFIDHERNPPTNPDFYNNPITAVGWQTTRWFQICGETVGGYWKNELGKTPERINEIYSGTPGSTWSTATNTSTVVNYFGPNGLGYIPAAPNTLGGWSGGTATMINNTINNGSFIMLHRDHGSTSGWGEPAYSSSNINALTNEDLIFVMSINCLTGKYNMSGECFAEKFHRHTHDGENAGALGITAASEVSYSFVNDTYVWGFIDNMWPDFMPDYGTEFPTDFAMPAFGNASGKIFLEQSNWPYNTSNKRVTYHLFHHHGGAFLTVHYEVPTELTVLHEGFVPVGSDIFEITADSGALISLYQDGNILATATATGELQAVAIPSNLELGSTVILTVTKQNHFRHEEELLVEDALIVNFESNIRYACPEASIDFTDLTEGEAIAWLWTFEGGEPATSTDQNPAGIMYNDAGVFDVTLEVTSPNSTESFTMEDYIHILENVEVSATVTATSNNICEGEETTFSLMVENGGFMPGFQWKLNGTDVGDGTNTFVSSALADGDVVSCEVTSSLQCTMANPVMSNEIVMTVNEVLPVSVSIETPGLMVCEGSEVEFTATPVNGGETPAYQWMVNGAPAGSNSPIFATSTLADGDVVSVELTSSEGCTTGNPAVSNMLTMNVVSELVAEVDIAASVNDICEGDEVSFTATPVNGGMEPVYQWKVNGVDAGENSDTFISTALADGDVVTCEMTSSFDCAVTNPVTSNPVEMAVQSIPAGMSIPQGPDYVDHQISSVTSYSTTDDPDASTYNWTVSPENAWTSLNVDMNTLEVSWDESYTGQASIEVYGSNDCGDGPLSGQLEVSVENTFGIDENGLNVGVSVFPNPNNGTFTLRLSSESNEKVKLSIRNMVGESLVSEEQISVNGEFVKTIDLSNYSEGLYLMMIENNGKVFTEKILVQK